MMLTKHEKRIKRSIQEQSFDTVIKCSKRDLATIATVLKNIPHEVVRENFELHQYFESRLGK